VIGSLVVADNVIERTIAVATHGRYLVAQPAAPGPAPLLVGFHGYAETAEVQLVRLESIPGAEGWLIVSVQGLNRFYQRRAGDVVAGWMTRQNRELAIADNLSYVGGIIDQVARDWPASPPLVFCGFSQGVAMAFRAAVATDRPVAGVIAVGGDVPPELDPAGLARVGTVLLCRGASDLLYGPEIFANDVRRLREAQADVRPLEFPGGHEWSGEVLSAAALLLRERQS
jgi:predicted esterase